MSGSILMHDTASGALLANYAGVLFKGEVLEGRYRFENFFHPRIGLLIERLSRRPLAEALDPDALSAETEFFEAAYQHIGPSDASFAGEFPDSESNVSLVTPLPRLGIDVSVGGPMSGYNLEALFHFQVAIACHLSKTQRFAEAQRWFHLVFDPTRPDGKYWRSLPLQGPTPRLQIDQLLRLLSAAESSLTPDELTERQNLLNAYQGIFEQPFQPFRVARTRYVAFQLMVVMRYLDNLLAWGDSLFATDSGEAIDFARGIYGQGLNLLGPAPERVPARRGIAGRSYAQLRALGQDRLGNAMIDLESQFPFNYGRAVATGTPAGGAPLFGVVGNLYFCVPKNDRLLRYWTDFDDRVHKIQSGMNLQGVVRRLALFDPPIDPALMVRAAARGIDLAAAVADVTRPHVPVRAPLLVQRAVELANEVRSFGGALLSALEKRDGEDLGLLRQAHEMRLLRAQREIRFLQWKQAEESTEVLQRTRAVTLDRYRYYLRLLGLAPDATSTPDVLPLRRDPITEESFDAAYEALVGTFDRAVPQLAMPALQLAQASSPSNASGAQGAGDLFLSRLEHRELNELMPQATDLRAASFALSTLASVLVFIPELNAKLAFWGLGAGAGVFGGIKMADALNIVAGLLSNTATLTSEQAAMVSRVAGYQRRADEWRLQANAAARELAQQGRQMIGSRLAEQASRREYDNLVAQIEDAGEVQEFLTSKFTGRDLQHWMQGELSRLHRQYFDFAVYAARKAEAAVKYELQRPELDGSDFVRGDYWDGGRRGLLSGEALHFDVKRLELAYHENNKYEDPIVKTISLRRLDPLALLSLQATGRCEFTIPEWFYDLDSAGQYMRRLRRVTVSIPAVTGASTPIVARLTLLASTTRVAPGGATYARGDASDDRFRDQVGAVEVRVNASPTSGSLPESPSARDQLLPFELAGAASTWRLALPGKYRMFDYATIADVSIVVEYTARSGGDSLETAANANLDAIVADASASGFALLIGLPEEFPTEWSQFANGTGPLAFDLGQEFFPYLAVNRTITVTAVEPYAVDIAGRRLVTGDALAAGHAAISSGLNDPAQRRATVTLPADAALTRSRDRRAFVVVRYSLT